MKPFTITYNKMTATVSVQMDKDRKLYRFEWAELTIDWIFWSEKKKEWIGETVLSDKQVRELGRKINEKFY
jgi:hypothetical protein